MPITFDTLEELEAFFRTFQLENARHAKSATATPDAPKAKRGRPPKAAVSLAKRGPKAKAQTAKSSRPKLDRGNTLTAKIRSTIQSFLDNSATFTANDIYQDLVQREPDVNKQSVITSVLKQMNSTFKTVSVKEVPGNGPRAVKLYNS